MKKRFLLSFVLTTFFILPLSALEHGPVVSVGVQGPVNVYPYESVAYKLMWEDFGIDFGLTILENPIYKCPLFSFEPGLNIYFGNFYIGGGLFITNYNELQVQYYARLGGIIGNWDLGPGKAGIDLGLSASPTVIVIDDEESAIGSAVGTVFATIFNIIKLNVGFTYYIPISN